MKLKDHLQTIAKVDVDESMASHTTFGIGGTADFFIQTHDEKTTKSVMKIAVEEGSSVFILGAGSNILVGDSGIRGVVLQPRIRNHEQLDIEESVISTNDGEYQITIPASTSFSRLARATARQGWSGLEWAAGIPGTLGGAIVYNAGAYGGCIADILTSIHILEIDGTDREISSASLGLAYRTSDFTRNRLGDRLILSATLQVHRRDVETTLSQLNDLEKRRKASAPRGRNAGSIFKNPREHPAWWLIDKVGLRGHRIGEAQISEKHTNYFINTGEARASDMEKLMVLTQQRVADEFGITLEPEVSRVGEGFIYAKC